MEFDGEFETHVTVRADAPDRVDRLVAWAASHRLKCLHIVVDGTAASQPMLTGRGRGTLSDRRRAADDWVRALTDAGFTVVRTKIEAAPDNRDVPCTDGEADRRTDECYFEHHVKLLLDPTADVSNLRTLAQRHSARLSRNALRVRPDGLAERFVTQHCRGVGRSGADARLAGLTADLASAGHRILEVEQEYVVHDTNAALDARSE